MSIKTKKMVLAAGVSALALMVMSSHVMAQDVGVSEPVGDEQIIDIMPVDPAIIDDIPFDPVIIDDEPFDPAINDDVPVDILIDVENFGATDDAGSEPDVTIDDGAVISDPDLALVDIMPVAEAGIDEPVVEVDPVVMIEDEGEPVEVHTLDDGTVVSVDVVAKTADDVLQPLDAPVILTAGQAAQDPAAEGSEIPNLCDTAAGQKNQFFCGSYHKK